ncbi:MAG: hypothetical protein PHO99_04125 [Candidatus Methanomethylophilaceae archaeon]|jgi:hypothetical protein|nr:hypothetical protein [Candidatus Methanomethylophilaceae archaeon]MDD2779401.1 hypothetical protein [Candidatus Methanomethylophilaceae archaeon]MDD4119640.1 hypothetical protein [Candidatus Methanomethylophilaceae archaeon]MDD4454678.1 hypothetical protein [Candidatus Methanomethylophilaceae archaeon]
MTDPRVMTDIRTRYGTFLYLGASTENLSAGVMRTLEYRLESGDDLYCVYADEIAEQPEEWEVTVTRVPGDDWEIHNISGLSLGSLTAAIESTIEGLVACSWRSRNAED